MDGNLETSFTQSGNNLRKYAVKLVIPILPLLFLKSFIGVFPFDLVKF